MAQISLLDLLHRNIANLPFDLFPFCYQRELLETPLSTTDIIQDCSLVVKNKASLLDYHLSMTSYNIFKK